MSNQIKAGLIKEKLFFWRSFRFVGILITFVGCSLLLPLMSAVMMAIGDMDMLNLTVASLDNEIDFTMDLDGMEALLSMYQGESGLLLSYSGTLMMFSDTALLVIMLMIMGAAGGEQKKRSIILPQTAGLSVPGYVLPKFMFYPAVVFVMTVVFSFFTNAVCHAVFKMSYSFEAVLITGVLMGIFMMFMVCLYLFLGISLTQPGLSVFYVYAANTVFMLLIPAFSIDRFTPFNLRTLADVVIINDANSRSVYQGIGASDLLVTVIISLALCVVFMLLTLFAMTAKRMDNTADEVY
jgi:ABC-2 type transport system permease protein